MKAELEKLTKEELIDRILRMESTKATCDGPSSDSPSLSYEGLLSYANNTAEVIIEFDSECKHLYVSPSIANYIDKNPADYIGKTHQELGYPEELSAYFERTIKKVFNSGEVLDDVFELVTPAGPTYMSWKLIPQFGANGVVQSVLTFSQNITEQRMAEFEAKESDSRFQTLFDSIPEMLIVHRMGVIEYANTSMVKFLQYSSVDELIGKDVAMLIHPEDYNSVKNRIYKRSPNESLPYIEERIVKKNGEVVYAEVGAMPIFFNNQEATLAIGRDITERREAEKEILQTRQRLEMVLDAVNDGFWDWNMVTNETHFSNRYYSMLGYDPGEFPATFDAWVGLMHPDGRASYLGKLDEYLNDPTGLFSVDMKLQKKDGEYIWVRSRGRIMEFADDSSPLRMLGTHTDITNIREAEDALKQSEFRFRQLADNARDLVFRFNLQNFSYDYINPAVFDSLGYTQEEIYNTPDILQQLFSPVWLEAKKESIQKLINHSAHDTLEFEAIDKNGDRKWFHQRTTLVRDEHGNAIALEGISVDVTGRKKIEDSMKFFAEDASRLKGKRFFEKTALFLAETFDVDSCSISQLSSGKEYTHTIAVALDGSIADNYSYRIVGTFCERVLNEGFYSCRANVISEYPESDDLINFGASGVMSILMRDDKNEPSGIICLISRKPLKDFEYSDTLFKLFGIRCANELEKMVYEEKLRENEFFLRSIFSAAKDIAFVTTDLNFDEPTIKEFSPGAEFIFGYSRQEAVSKPLAMLFSRDMENIVYDSIHEENDLGLKAEINLVRKSGEKFPAFIRTYPLYNYIGEVKSTLAVIMDTSAIKQMEDIIHIKDYSIDSANFPIILTDEFAKITYANKAFASLFGFAHPEAAIGANTIELIDIKSYEKLRKELFLNGFSQGEAKGLKLDGTNFHMEYNVSIVKKKSGEPIYILVSLTDITEKKKAEYDLNKLNIELEQRVLERTSRLNEVLKELRQEIDTRKGIQEKLQQSQRELSTALTKEKEINSLKSSFISMVSHEYKTPLTAIMSATELLSRFFDLGDKEKHSKYIERIAGQVKAMNSMLEDVLLLGIYDSSSNTKQLKTSNLTELTRQLTEESRTIDKSRHDIYFRPNSSIIMIAIDNQAYSHVLTNLLSNAQKYSPVGSKITVELADKGSVVSLKVKDNGIGIADNELPFLFENFFRGSNVGSAPGTGLGLAIVKRALNEMNGEIIADSRVGEGTTFTVLLPKVII